jgi:hypothetical protein
VGDAWNDFTTGVQVVYDSATSTWSGGLIAVLGVAAVVGILVLLRAADRRREAHQAESPERR